MQQNAPSVPQKSWLCSDQRRHQATTKKGRSYPPVDRVTECQTIMQIRGPRLQITVKLLHNYCLLSKLLSLGQ